MRIGVKFCGNCNPCVDAPELIRTLGANTSEFEFVRWNDSHPYEVLLVFSGCQVGCANRPAFDGPCVVATSECVQCWPVAEDELTAAIVKALRDCQVT